MKAPRVLLNDNSREKGERWVTCWWVFVIIVVSVSLRIRSGRFLSNAQPYTHVIQGFSQTLVGEFRLDTDAHRLVGNSTLKLLG